MKKNKAEKPKDHLHSDGVRVIQGGQIVATTHVAGYANLFAAAPDTYGVCKLVMVIESHNAADRDYPTVEQWNEIVKAARAAIIRAKEGK